MTSSPGGRGTTIGTITVDDLAKLVAAEPTTRVVDVRTPEEFAEVRAATAVNVPLDSINPVTLASAYAGGPGQGAKAGQDGQPVYLICRSGARSMRAAEFLTAHGCSALVNVTGGTLAWSAGGFPVKRGSN